jgi:hypothetical protein
MCVKKTNVVFRHHCYYINTVYAVSHSTFLDCATVCLLISSQDASSLQPNVSIKDSDERRTVNLNALLD